MKLRGACLVAVFLLMVLTSVAVAVYADPITFNPLTNIIGQSFYPSNGTIVRGTVSFNFTMNSSGGLTVPQTNITNITFYARHRQLALRYVMGVNLSQNLTSYRFSNSTVGLPNGVYDLIINITNVSNRDYASLTVGSFVVDNFAPTVVLNVYPVGHQANNTLLFNISAQDHNVTSSHAAAIISTTHNLSNCSLVVDDIVVNTTTASGLLGGLGNHTVNLTMTATTTDGRHTAFVACHDLAREGGFNGVVGNRNVSITITFTVGLPPILFPIGNKTINETETLTVQLQASDPSNDTLVFATDAYSILPSNFTFNATTGLFIWTPTSHDSGNYTISFNVSDGLSYDTENVTVTVNNVPIILQSIGNTQVDENRTLIIQLLVIQPTNTTFVFATNAGLVIPSEFIFNMTTGLFIWEPTFRDAGVYAITFNVTDGEETASETINITVNNVNLAPEFLPIGVQEVTEGFPYEFTVNATDFDGDPLIYSTDAQAILPSPFTFNRTNGEFNWQTRYTDYGYYNVTFRASDGNLSDELIVTMVVRDAQLSNLLMVGAPRIGNTVQLLLADRTAINQPYILLMSSSTESPLALGDGRFVGLTPNTVFLVSLYLPSLIGLRESVGIFNTAGNAIATWTVPNAPELVNTTVHFAFVSLDTVQSGARAIISVSPTVSTTVIA